MTLVVNLFGGPSAGKSTTAAGIYHQLKKDSVETEYVREYAKDIVWEGREHLFDNQIYIFAKQHKRLMDVFGKVDVAIMDCPLLLSLHYSDNLSLHNLVLHERWKMDTFDVFLERPEEYDDRGRMQTHEEAKAMDSDIKRILSEHADGFIGLRVNDNTVDTLCSMITSKLEKRKS